MPYHEPSNQQTIKPQHDNSLPLPNDPGIPRFPFSGSAKVQMCPADKSTLESQAVLSKVIPSRSF